MSDSEPSSDLTESEANGLAANEVSGLTAKRSLSFNIFYPKSTLKKKLILIVFGILLLGGGITGYFIWNQPFDMVVVLMEGKKARLDDLSLDTGLELAIDDDTFSGQFQRDGSMIFRKIPGRFKRKKAMATLTSGYWIIAYGAAKLELKPGFSELPLARNPDLAQIRGRVRAEEDYLMGATVTCCEVVKATSDGNGNFVLNIPEDRQKPTQYISIFLEGYVFYQNEVKLGEELPDIMLLPKEE